MKAIQVKYLPATNTKGSRFKAFTRHQSVTVPFNYGMSDQENISVAAEKLIEKMNWSVTISGRGLLPNGDEVFTLKSID